MKTNSIDFMSEDFDDVGVDELDFTEKAMYERAFKKFYFRKLKPNQLLEDDNDCMDIEDDLIETEVEPEDLEIESEDI